jgi:predicted transcriptional regulator of viral defense system
VKQTPKSSFQHLYEIAEAQQGFFTTKQAKAAGYAGNTHPYHVQAGNWIRQHRGIYRLAHFPPTDHPDLAIWSLWSRNRNEKTEGVYSHQTALSTHELSDVNPAKLHMIVPPHFRRNSEIPGILVLHHGIVQPHDIQTAQGFQVTRPLRTILDVVEDGTVERAFVRQAIRQAFDRGLITRSDLRKANLSDPAKKLFSEVRGRAA